MSVAIVGGSSIWSIVSERNGPQSPISYDASNPTVLVRLSLEAMKPDGSPPTAAAEISLILSGFKQPPLDSTEESSATLSGIGDTKTFDLLYDETNDEYYSTDSQSDEFKLSLGVPPNYPFDYYRFWLEPEVQLEGPISENLPKRRLFLLWVTNEDIGSTWEIDRRSFSFEESEESIVSDAESTYGLHEQINLTFERPVPHLIFIFSVALLPLLIALVLLSRRLNPSVAASDNTSPLELASAALALLALRQVLVPSDIRGFTLLDRVLAFELTLVIAIAASSHLWKKLDSLPRTAHPPARSAPASARNGDADATGRCAFRYDSRSNGSNASDPDPSAEWWTTTDVATFLSVRPATVSRYRGEGRMPSPENTNADSWAWRPATIIEWNDARRRSRANSRKRDD
ncbi:hypothetical protein OWR29_39970 [Actinoplanes sp. Pm04-4]|uniref:Helix-turn-helix domain-containing protein n=1 Tax=Paractinoplanes pyxinae TaxID=2997416 RepID=A0ABT4BDY7_9ACTN|nr:hypothetical protein [Actinoplanes pyxinae]MCY1144207.1 hypothetical protein [Actinoplanes pyxinae]